MLMKLHSRLSCSLTARVLLDLTGRTKSFLCLILMSIMSSLDENQLSDVTSLNLMLSALA